MIPPDPAFPDPGDDLEGSRTFVLGILAVIAVVVVGIVWCLVRWALGV
jgi:hypothetical protein